MALFNNVYRIDDNHHISYLPGNTPLAFASDGHPYGETALVTAEPWNCLILNGDWRSEYMKVLAGGFAPCYDLYLSKKDEHGSSWSN